MVSFELSRRTSSYLHYCCREAEMGHASVTSLPNSDEWSRAACIVLTKRPVRGARRLLNPISSACVRDGSLADDVKLFRRLSMLWWFVRAAPSPDGRKGPAATAALRCSALLNGPERTGRHRSVCGQAGTTSTFAGDHMVHQKLIAKVSRPGHDLLPNHTCSLSVRGGNAP